MSEPAVIDFIMGMNAKVYQGDKDALLSAMAEMSNVKDLTCTMECGDADVTTRGNSGWRGIAPTLRSLTLEFEMVWKPGDACFEAMKTAYLTGITVELCALTGPKDEVASEGPKGGFAITNFSRKGPLEEAVTVSVTAKLCKWDDWTNGVAA